MVKHHYNTKLDIPSDADSARFFVPAGYTARLEEGVLVVEPEESEGERIRREIIDFICWEIDRGSVTKEQREKSNSWLAYLEKQKEQKPSISGNDFGWIDELRHDLEHPEELDQKVDDVFKQIKGIRAFEWSEEDKFQLNAAIDAISNIGLDITANWIKSLPERFSLQPKQEWSAEDEKMYKAISIALTMNEAKGYLRSWYMTPEDADAWLKSLRPQPRWKPSARQLMALDGVKRRMSLEGYGLCPDLQKLLDDLRELM